MLKKAILLRLLKNYCFKTIDRLNKKRKRKRSRLLVKNESTLMLFFLNILGKTYTRPCYSILCRFLLAVTDFKMFKVKSKSKQQEMSSAVSLNLKFFRHHTQYLMFFINHPDYFLKTKFCT